MHSALVAIAVAGDACAMVVEEEGAIDMTGNECAMVVQEEGRWHVTDKEDEYEEVLIPT